MAKLLPIFLLMFCLSSVARAQSDTANYDLGRILVKKQFTQNITVKAHDLEQLQFSDLADAINVWFYGSYTNAHALVYVIDGNIINDVNAYSIYDIDEVTLVQNALGQVSGISPGQQMVLIKLKTEKPGKQGITAAGQTSVVGPANTNSTQGSKSNSSIYQNYYASGFKNFNNFSLGLSADYQRDVSPQIVSESSSSSPPFYFNRLKLNLWGTAKLGPENTVTIGVNYVPQASVISDSYTLYNPSNSTYLANYQNNGHVSQHLFNATLAIKSDMSGLFKGLANNFSAAYNHYNYFYKNAENYDAPAYTLASTTYPEQYGIDGLTSSQKVEDFLIRDNLSFVTKVGNFELNPSVNFSFRNVHDAFDYGLFLLSGEGAPTDLSTAVPSYEYSAYAVQYKTYLLTPSLNVVYKNFLNVQAGFVDILNNSKDFLSGYAVPRLFPFLTATAAIDKIPGFNTIHLKIFASYSRQNQVLNDEYTSLESFAPINNTSGTGAFLSTSTNVQPITASYVSPYQSYNNYQAGFALHIPRNFSINYSFEYRGKQALEEIEVPFSENQAQTELIYVNANIITNRIGFDYYLASNSCSWKTALNFASSKIQLSNDAFNENNLNSYLSSGQRWSGGFTNRFDYNTFFAGLDVMYQIGSRPYPYNTSIPLVPDNVTPTNTNSFSLQNLYIGKAITIKHLERANIFLTSRNLLQNKATEFIDNRRFFGFGFKAEL